ncbi:Talin-1, partial [Ameca splendens]
MAASVHEISNLIDPVAVAARSEASHLGHKVSQMASYFEPLIMAAIGTASKILSSQQQMAVLDQTKTLAESALQMLYTAKEAGGNPKAAYMQNALEDSVQMMKEAVDDLGATLGEAASAAGAVGGMVDSINHAINKMEDGPADEPDGTFVDYQTTMVKTAKAIAVTVQEMVTKSNSNPDDLGGLANHLTNNFGNLANEAKYAALTAENDEIGSHIKKQVGELGFTCTSLVTKAGALQCSPNDSFTKKELIESARKVSEKVSHVLASLQAGNRGTQACITAASAVAGIIADLDTTIMFATAGTLNRENAETFADHREYILKTAKALVEDTKLLVSGAGASQERLAQAAQSSVSTITKLADVVKLGAASLGSEDPETQVVLINAVKDVAKALGNLISATKAAAGKPHDDPSMLQLKSSAKVMVTNVTSLLKTVKAVEDEATKGTRALEATIEHIKQELTVFCSSDPPPKTTTPEEFIRMTKGITVATAKAVAAGNSCRQEDIIATANLSRRAIADMLHSCK